MPEKLLAPARHETSDVGMPFIWIGVSLLFVTVLALALLVLWLFPGSTIDQAKRLAHPQFPNPQLQPNPRENMARFYAEEMQRLNGTGWVDKAKSTVHIPIENAMRKVAEEGIQGWPRPVEKRP
jgi:hypothetical protein